MKKINGKYATDQEYKDYIQYGKERNENVKKLKKAPYALPESYKEHLMNKFMKKN